MEMFDMLCKLTYSFQFSNSFYKYSDQQKYEETKEFKYNNESLFKKLITRYNDGTKYKVFLFLLKQSKTKLYKHIESPNKPYNET